MTGTVLTVIVNYKSPEMTLRSARSAEQAMQGIAGGIVVVDNDSQDGSFEFLSRHLAETPAIRVIQSGRNGGFGFGVNTGIRAGLPDGERPDFVYLLNPDAFPRADTVRLLRAHMLENPQVGFVGSAIFGEDGAPHHAAFRFPSILSEFEAAAQTGPISRLLRSRRIIIGFPKHPCAVDWCSGASVMLRQRMLDEIGLFDEEFFLYFEETDLNRRGRASGWLSVHLPQAVVTHIGSVSTGMGNWNRVPRYWFDSRARYFLKHHGRTYLGLVTLSYLCGAAILRLRQLFQRKEDGIPPYFLRDLVAHTMGTYLPGRLSASESKEGQAP